MNITRTLVVATSLTFTLCVAGQVRPNEPQLLAKPSEFPAYPLKASTNGRYLVDQNGTPTLLVGDSPHSLFVNLSPHQADAYFANRASYGINAVWVEVLCNTYTAGRSDGSTYDGIIPFTTPGDMSTPNRDYFTRVDQMVRLAANHGIQIFMDAFETAGWMPVLEQNGIQKALKYGKFLGNRYKNFNNIIWITGNDFQTWNTSSTDNHLVAAIMRGIASTDPNHLQTTELNYLVSGSLDDPLLVPIPRWREPTPTIRPTRRFSMNTMRQISFPCSWRRRITSLKTTLGWTTAIQKLCAGRSTGPC